MNPNQTHTALVGQIKDKNGQVIGLMSEISVTENFDRVRVREIGTAPDVDVPLVAYGGSVTASGTVINYLKITADARVSGLQPLNRDVTEKQFFLNLILNPEGWTLHCFKRVEDGFDANGNVIDDAIPFISVTKMFITGDGFSIRDQAATSQTQSFIYTGALIKRS